MIILLGESGSGKSTIEKKLVSNGFKRVIGTTTRPPRVGEVGGVDYNFVTESEFDEIVAKGKFAEFATYNGFRYGTKKEDCKDACVKVIEPIGFRLLRESGIKLTSFFIKTSLEFRAFNMLRRGDSYRDVISNINYDRILFKDIEEEVDFVLNNSEEEDIIRIVEFIKLIM